METKRSKSNVFEDVRIPYGWEKVENTSSEIISIERISDRSKFSFVTVDLDIPNKEEKTLDELVEIYAAYFKLYPDFGRSKLTERSIFKLKSVIKNNGFYLSSFMIHKNQETEKPQSLPEGELITDITVEDAQEIASTFEDSKDVKCFVVNEVEQRLLYANCYNEKEDLTSQEDKLTKMVDRWKKQCALTDIADQVRKWGFDYMQCDTEPQPSVNNDSQIILGGIRLAIYLD